MKPHKVNQEVFHRTAQIDDFMKEGDYLVESLTADQLYYSVIDYFYTEKKPTFPAKSYSVAIIYGFLLQKYFKEDLYESLNDESLFYYNDRFFKTYRKDSETYDKVISYLKKNNMIDFEISKIAQVQASVGYFYAEYLLRERPS